MAKKKLGMVDLTGELHHDDSERKTLNIIIPLS